MERLFTAKYGFVRRLSIACIVGVPALALLGWILHVPALRVVVPGSTPMNPLSALCFIAFGLCWWLVITHQTTLTRQRRHLVITVGVTLMALGALIAARNLIGLHFYPDTMLFADQLNGNKMAPNTALGFMLLGLILVSLPSSKLRQLGVVRLTAVILCAIASSAIMGYVFNLLPLYALGTLTPMALHVAALFMIVSSNILSLKFKEFTLSGKVLASLVVMLTAILGVLSLVIAGASDQQALRAQTNQTEHINELGDQLLSALKDAETGQRGYLLTGDKAYLEPYTTAEATYTQLLDQLRDAVRSDDDQQPRIAALATATAKKIHELDQTITLYSSGAQAAAITVVKSNQGKAYMDEIRQQIGGIIADARSDQSATAARQAIVDARTMAYVEVVSALAVIFLIMVLLLLAHESRRRAAAESQLRSERNSAVAARSKDEAILSSIGDGVFALDTHNKIILFNKAAEYISGFTEAEVLGKPYGEALFFTDVNGKRERTSFITIAQKGRPATMARNTFLRTKQGELLPVDDSAAPIYNADGVQLGCIVVFRDVTKQRELDRAKDEFISLVSHQLRTPLTAIRLFTEMLTKGDVGALNPKQQDYLDKVYLSTQRMIQLVGDILNVSRIELGRIKIQPAPTDVNELITSHIAEVAPLAKQKNVEISFTPEQSQAQVAVDATMYGQIIHNLLTNAIRYSRDEGGKVNVAFTKTNNGFTLSVRDNGIGIPVAAQPHMFERFYRADNARLAVGEGTGLGLYLIKLILDTAGGTIRFESHEGEGTTFYVALPPGGMKSKQGEKSLS